MANFQIRGLIDKLINPLTPPHTTLLLMNCKNAEVVKINEFILLPVCITSRRQRL